MFPPHIVPRDATDVGAVAPKAGSKCDCKSGDWRSGKQVGDWRLPAVGTPLAADRSGWDGTPWGSLPFQGMPACPSGMAGGAAQAVAMCPSTRLKTAQISLMGSMRSSHVALHVLQTDGPFGLFKGLQPLMLRQVTSWGCRFGFTGLYEGLLKDWTGKARLSQVCQGLGRRTGTALAHGTILPPTGPWAGGLRTVQRALLQLQLQLSPSLRRPPPPHSFPTEREGYAFL